MKTVDITSLLVSSGKYLPEGYNSEEPQKANDEEESNHPWQGRILDILSIIRYSRLFGDGFAHTKKVTSKATWEFNQIVQKTQYTERVDYRLQ